MVWLLRSKALNDRLAQWAALISPWNLEIVKDTRGEDAILGLVAASIAHRKGMNEALESIHPMKSKTRQKLTNTIPHLDPMATTNGFELQWISKTQESWRWLFSRGLECTSIGGCLRRI